MFPTRFQSLSIKAVRVLVLLLAATIASSTPGQTPPQLTEAQAQALIKRLSTAPATSRPLTVAETNGLLKYVAEQAKNQAVAAQAEAAAAAAAAKPKKVRLGIVMPRVDLGPGFSGDAAAEPLRGMIAHYLSGPVMELVPHDGLVSQQINAEAQAKQCDFVLYSSATQKKTGGNGMSLFKGATTMANMLPMVQAAKLTGGLITDNTTKQIAAGSF